LNPSGAGTLAQLSDNRESAKGRNREIKKPEGIKRQPSTEGALWLLVFFAFSRSVLLVPGDEFST
jgi:hypothetical protein